ncbi:MAG: hypothetical protein QM763_00065 [Agriterribacter sp.]
MSVPGDSRVGKNPFTAGSSTPLPAICPAVPCRDDVPATPDDKAAISDNRGSTGVPGVAPFFLYQLFTLMLNLSPLITFSSMPGPILLSLPFVRAT